MTDMIDPKFLVVRYANGSAGKFLINLLMASKSVAHFDPLVEQNKTDKSCMRYTQEHFVNETHNWLKYEPNHTDAWNLHHISAKYTRGEDLSVEEFLTLAKQNATEHFWNSVSAGRSIPMVWHKKIVPAFFKSSKFITIIIDPDSEKWYHRARWYKQFGMIDQMIHMKEHDPEFNHQTLKIYHDKFQNSSRVKQHPFSFIKENIINYPVKKMFQKVEEFQTPAVEQEFVALSDILDTDRCVNAVAQICKKFDFEPISEDLVMRSQKHWLSCHDFKYTTK